MPQLCSGVVAHARETLGYVALHVSVDAPAAALDDYAEEGWARKAWRTFCAFEAYAEARASGWAGGDFQTWCEQSGSPDALAPSMVARHESKTTRRIRRFRTLRVLPVDSAAVPDGHVEMEAHIRIEKGGVPRRVSIFTMTRRVRLARSTSAGSASISTAARSRETSRTLSSAAPASRWSLAMKRADCEAVYTAAGRFVDEALRRDGSLLSH